MSGILERIVASKRVEIEALRAEAPPPPAAEAPRDVRARLARPPGAPLRLLAEIKHRSPSAGPLSRALSVEDRALAYADAGAAMISVLCDGPFFDGAWDHLARARSALAAGGRDALVLAKEFVLDEVQLARAASAGADAVLLIARITPARRLTELVRAAREAGVEPLVEVVDEAELAAALEAGARLVGVNARDLDTLQMDRERAARVLAAIPPDVVAIHLSGLRSAADVAEIARGPSAAALVGEALMRLDAPGPLLAAMVLAAATPRT